MKFTITTEISNDLAAAVMNAMVIVLLMEVDKCYAEQKSSELLDQSICNASCENNKEIMTDKYIKVVDLFHQDPFIKRGTLGRKKYPKSCDSYVEMRKKENTNPHKLIGANQDDKIKNEVNDTISNIYSKKEITSGLEDKTNELRGKIIITSNNRIEKMPTSVEMCNRLKKKKTSILLKTDNKQVEIMSHFKPTYSQSVTTLTDETLKIGNEHRYVIRKIRQIDPAQASLTSINDRNNNTFYYTIAVKLPKSDNNNNIFITQDDKANENLKIVKDASNYSDRMEKIINKSPKLDLNEANNITMDEKRPSSYYNKSTRPAKTNKSTSLPKFSDEALKRNKASLNYINKKLNNKKSDRKRKSTKNNKIWLREKDFWNSTENYEAMQKILNINKTKSNIESNDLMLKIVNKIQNYYKSYETKSILLSKSNGIRHKLPYARTLQYKGQDLIPFFGFFSSPRFSQKYEITNRFKNIQDIIDYKMKLKTYRFNGSRSTRASSDLYYIKLAKNVFGTANNQYDTTTPLILQNDPDKPLDIFDENEADDDDDLVSSAAAISGMYQSHNNCNNDNDNRYNYYTHAITNENNVNNVILINMRTTSPPTTTTTPTTTMRHTIYPDVQVIKEDFPMDHNLLIAIIFTSFIILVFTTCCCAPIVLIKKQNECVDTQGKTSSSATSSTDSEDSTISYHCKSNA